MPIAYEWRGAFDDDSLSDLHAQGFDHPVLSEAWRAQLERQSLGWVCAFDDDQLVGFVNVAWDGGTHAFVLDTLLTDDARRRGVDREMIAMAVAETRAAGLGWLHPDAGDASPIPL
jgi:hypothetical protein